MDKKNIRLILALLLGIIILFFIHRFLYNNSVINVDQASAWKNFPGATGAGNGIHVTPLGRMIIHQDGSKGQPNPPVNLDQHFLVKGDFDLTATLLKIDKQASLRLYSAVPIVYDQWRKEPGSIELTVDAADNVITVRIWDGNASSPVDMRSYYVSLPSEVTVSLQHIKDEINVIYGGRLLGSIPDHHIFDGGQVWLGADASVGSSGFTIDSLKIRSLKSGTVKVAPELLPPAKENNVTSKIKIGTAINPDILFFDQQYKDLALTQFNIFTPENVMKPQFIHPQPKIYDFSQADQLAYLALKNNIAIHGHALVYSKSTPEWMTKSPKEDLEQIMVSHIKTVVSHFKGKVAQWDVVNEAFSQKHALYGFGKSGLEENIWLDTMGEEYIDLAFKTAHEADPDAKLYLNDYGIENDGAHWDALLALVKRLKQRGAAIDGVGFESHIYTDGDYINKDQLKRHMESLAKLGLLTRISEIDVTGDDPKEQINQYVTVLDVCLRAPNCTSYTTWGIMDKYGSTTRADRYPLVYGTSLLWDKDYKAKPALEAIQKRLGQN